MKKTQIAMAFAGLFIGLIKPLPAQANSEQRLEQLLSLSLEELLETTVTISTNTRQTLSKAPSVVSVITAEDIKATGATNLAEILKSVPGVYVRANLFGFRPQISVRGGASTQTLLMVNGAPMRDLVWNTGIFWRGLPTSMIERVEIIRGPGSALFGSDASAGVINVITKTAGKIEQSEAGLRIGSFDTQEGWVQHGGDWNGFDIGVTAELSHTDGHKPFISYASGVTYPPGNAGYGYDNADLRFSIGKGDWRLLGDHIQKNNIEVGLVGRGALDPLTKGRDSRTNLQLFYDNTQFGENWGLNAELRYYHLNYSSGEGFQETPPPGPIIINQMRSAEQGLNIEVSGLYKGIKSHALRVGGGYSLSDLYFVREILNGVDTVFVPQQTRQIGYLFAQDIWTFAEDWELTAGARYDHYSKFGGAFNPRLALFWQSTPRLTTKLMYGEAFRAPSLLETAAQNSANQPNPNLDPEESKTWDLSFSYFASKDMKLGLTFYQFVQTNPVLPVSGKYENTESKTAHGFELEAQWQIAPTFRVSGNLSHRTEPDPPSTVNPLPKNQAYLRTDWAFRPHWNWNVEAGWVGKQLPYDDVTYGMRAQIDAYAVINTTINYAYRRDWEFAASIRNLFDVDAREYSSGKITNNLPLPGRNFYAEVRYKF